jgi:hypothetical protein
MAQCIQKEPHAAASGRPLVTSRTSHPATGQRPAVARQPRVSLTVCGTPNFLQFFNYFFDFCFGSVENGPRLLGEWVYNTPIFWSLPLYLEVLNVPFFMEIGDFYSFSNFIFLNLEYTWTFISTVGIFVSWKIKITKNSVRFASVMEMFCTLLQCRVHLSMFHSSSTSKIWHTST